MLECVVNLSEGRDAAVVDALSEAAAGALLDVHSDPHHHRSVLTLAGPALDQSVRSLARAALDLIDIRRHTGVHPRLGALDVVPFVPLDAGGAPCAEGTDLGPALAARDRFASWAGTELALPCFLYGPDRALPDVRRRAFIDLQPDTGPPRPHPSAGACAVGARGALVAFNLWLATDDVDVARAVAANARRPGLRTLGLSVGGTTQVSCNLLDPFGLGPAEVHDVVEALARYAGTRVVRAELVGLVPAAVVQATPPDRWEMLDLDPERTVEARLARLGIPRRPERD